MKYTIIWIAGMLGIVAAIAVIQLVAWLMLQIPGGDFMFLFGSLTLIALMIRKAWVLVCAS